MNTQEKTKKFDPYTIELDEEERKILKSYEDGELRSVDNLAQEMKLAKEIAANTLRKDARITLRISSSEIYHALNKKLPIKGYLIRLSYLVFYMNMLLGILEHRRSKNDATKIYSKKVPKVAGVGNF